MVCYVFSSSIDREEITSITFLPLCHLRILESSGKLWQYDLSCDEMNCTAKAGSANGRGDHLPNKHIALKEQGRRDTT
jgi:hypothetical protein